MHAHNLRYKYLQLMIAIWHLEDLLIVWVILILLLEIHMNTLMSAPPQEIVWYVSWSIWWSCWKHVRRRALRHDGCCSSHREPIPEKPNEGWGDLIDLVNKTIYNVKSQMQNSDDNDAAQPSSARGQAFSRTSFFKCNGCCKEDDGNETTSFLYSSMIVIFVPYIIIHF